MLCTGECTTNQSSDAITMYRPAPQKPSEEEEYIIPEDDETSQVGGR